MALKEATKLASGQHAVLRLVHVVDPVAIHAVVEAPYIVEYQRTLEAASEKVIADSSAIPRAAGIKFDTVSIGIETRGQHVCDLIEEESKDWQADVIVIGAHGRRGFRRMFLGSVAEGLIRIASKPVLLVPNAVASSV